MIDVNLKPLTESTVYQKNNLYKINESCKVIFEEKHETTKEIVELEYCLESLQYGIFANEFRSHHACKQGCKTTDILACAVNTEEKKIYTTILDVKSNISAFSDDLLKNQAMLTAIKEVRDFINQIHDELLHKDSFMLYYIDGGYTEKERIAIVTKSFEAEKFLAVADLLEKLCQESDSQIPTLIELKLKTGLKPYLNQVEPLRYFAEKKIKIRNKTYDLHVFLLQKLNDTEHYAKIEIACEN